MHSAPWARHRSAAGLATLWATLIGSAGAHAQDSVHLQEAEETAPDSAIQPDEEPEVEGVHRRPFLPIGVTLGWLGNRDGSAFVVGGEVSLVWVELARHPGGMFPSPKDASAAFGLVLDAVWVSNPSHFRASLGAEVIAAFGGPFFAGLEAGVTVHSRRDVVGFRTRGFFTLWWPTIYAGIDYHGRIAGEVGLLVKLPLDL